MELDLKDILGKIKNGEKKYYRTIINAYNPYLLSIARYYLNSSYDSQKDIEDALQETWIKIFKYIEILEEPDKFPSWIAKIMKNQCLNMQKKNIKNIEKNVYVDLETRDDLLSLCSSEENDQWYGIKKKELREIIDLILKNMSDEYSLPMKLYYLDNFKFKEIAEILEVPVSTLKWRLFQGRKVFKEFLLEHME